MSAWRLSFYTMNGQLFQIEEDSEEKAYVFEPTEDPWKRVQNISEVRISGQLVSDDLALELLHQIWMNDCGQSLHSARIRGKLYSVPSERRQIQQGHSPVSHV